MIKTGRRDFLKTAGIFSALLVAKPFFGKADAKDLREEKSSSEYRTLGTESAAMKVAPLGFGCMGMNTTAARQKTKKK